jgi:DNA-binding protein
MPEEEMTEKREEKKQERKERAESNVVFIGKKPAMSYVLACVTQFNDGRDDVILKARGRAISHAVDVAEIVKNKFVTNAEVKNVTIGTEEVQSEQGEKLNVSSIEIILGKK